MFLGILLSTEKLLKIENADVALKMSLYINFTETLFYLSVASFVN